MGAFRCGFSYVWTGAILAALCLSVAIGNDSFESAVKPFLDKHCVACHSGDKVKGEVDFSTFQTMTDAQRDPELWEVVAAVIEDEEMPPSKEPQPSEAERDAILQWIDERFFGQIESLPSVFRTRRLSGPEYRHTLRSLFGFDLEVEVIEAEQTVTERSLVLKLLPTDPPGESGFVNDTHRARLSTTIWDQYVYLTDTALQKLFKQNNLPTTSKDAKEFLRDFTTRAFRRDQSDENMKPRWRGLTDKSGTALTNALKEEMRVVLLSPSFLYRGMLVRPTHPEQIPQKLDSYELAERLSYFLWEDMPDTELFEWARDGDHDSDAIEQQVKRMLASTRSRSLASSFGSQWLLLDQIESPRKDPVYTHALRNQPIEFFHYLITEDRPITDLIQSEVTFFNANIGNYYGND
ncbi:MAG: DUF1592 domain-containing protein, partial [Verrucomicrobiota bacterium]